MIERGIHERGYIKRTTQYIAAHVIVATVFVHHPEKVEKSVSHYEHMVVRKVRCVYQPAPGGSEEMRAPEDEGEDGDRIEDTAAFAWRCEVFQAA